MYRTTGLNTRTLLGKLTEIGSWVPERLRIIHGELTKVKLGVVLAPALRASSHVGVPAFDNQLPQLPQPLQKKVRLAILEVNMAWLVVD